MPRIIPILDEIRDEDPTGESLKLFLPSDLSAEDRDAWCPPDIAALEVRFRYAQSDDCLAELRRLCRLFQGLRDQSAKHHSHVQRNVTRSEGLQEGFWSKIRRCGSRYSHARGAMLALDPDQKLSPGWAQRFKKLNEKDLRGPGQEEEERSEGQFTPSWIWLVPRSNLPPTASTSPNDTAAADAGKLADYMRAHWAKCQARAERYEEEVALTVEEMGRTLRYFEWKRSWWLSLQSVRARSESPPPAEVQRGLQAYAHRQANIYQTLITSFVTRWRKTLIALELNPPWLSRYPTTVNSPSPSPPQQGHPQQETESIAGVVDPEASHTALRSPSSPSQHHGDDTTPTIDMEVDDASGDTDAPLANDVETDNGNDDDDDDDDEEYIVDEMEAFDADD